MLPAEDHMQAPLQVMVHRLHQPLRLCSLLVLLDTVVGAATQQHTGGCCKRRKQLTALYVSVIILS